METEKIDEDCQVLEEYGADEPAERLVDDDDCHPMITGAANHQVYVQYYLSQR